MSHDEDNDTGEHKGALHERVEALRNFFPDALEKNWKLQDAGQRVQIIKKSADGRGKLEFGTEIVASKDGSRAASHASGVSHPHCTARNRPSTRP